MWRIVIMIGLLGTGGFMMWKQWRKKGGMFGGGVAQASTAAEVEQAPSVAGPEPVKVKRPTLQASAPLPDGQLFVWTSAGGAHLGARVGSGVVVGVSPWAVTIRDRTGRLDTVEIESGNHLLRGSAAGSRTSAF